MNARALGRIHLVLMNFVVLIGKPNYASKTNKGSV